MEVAKASDIEPFLEITTTESSIVKPKPVVGFIMCEYLISSI